MAADMKRWIYLMFHFVTSYMNHTKKRRQTFESAQYGFRNFNRSTFESTCNSLSAAPANVVYNFTSL